LIPKKGFAFFNYLTMRGATTKMENKAVGSAQQNISRGNVEETQVFLPPTALVERFAEAAIPLFECWISNIHQSRTLATLHDTLLPHPLSG
jgi:type I restriction enzyme S subunit